MKTPFPLLLLSIMLLSCESEEEPKNDDDCLTVKTSTNGLPVADRYIISLPAEDNPGSGRTTATKLLAKHNLDDSRIINHFQGRFSSFVLSINSEEADRLARDPGVQFVEPDRIVSMCACFTVVEPSLITWNVDKVGYGNGEGKTAWLLDTGIDLTHPDLNIDVVRSQSFVTDSPSPQDENGHGTHVAGIVGALNNRIGTLGVASGAKLVGIRVLDKDGNGYVSYVLDALAYVHKHARAGEVVNISLSVDDMSDILDKEIESIAAKGIYVTIAAGNESDLARKYSPGRTNGKNIFTVSAVDSLNQFASFSNYGNDVIDYAAPGVNVMSTYIDGKYAIMSGTSMASPHVAGLLLINDGKINSVATALNDPDGVGDPIARK
jgi:Subtilisin-like serine proteases